MICYRRLSDKQLLSVFKDCLNKNVFTRSKIDNLAGVIAKKLVHHDIFSIKNANATKNTLVSFHSHLHVSVPFSIMKQYEIFSFKAS
jgi:hypothetical protein